ncbi:hypothetical protein BB560_006306, partial [Smittium megazygosporum]
MDSSNFKFKSTLKLKSSNLANRQESVEGSSLQSGLLPNETITDQSSTILPDAKIQTTPLVSSANSEERNSLFLKDDQNDLIHDNTNVGNFNNVQLSLGKDILDSSSSDESEDFDFSINKAEIESPFPISRSSIGATASTFLPSSSQLNNQVSDDQSNVLAGKRKLVMYGRNKPILGTDSEPSQNFATANLESISQRLNNPNSSNDYFLSHALPDSSYSHKKFKYDATDTLDYSSVHNPSLFEETDSILNDDSEERLISEKFFGKMKHDHILKPESSNIEQDFQSTSNLPTDGRLYPGKQWVYEDADINAVPFGKSKEGKHQKGKKSNNSTKNAALYEKFGTANIYDQDIDTSFTVGIVDSSESYNALFQARGKSLKDNTQKFKLSDFYQSKDAANQPVDLNTEIQKIADGIKKEQKTNVLSLNACSVSTVPKQDYSKPILFGSYYTASTFSGKILYFQSELKSMLKTEKESILRDNKGWVNSRISLTISKIEAELEKKQVSRQHNESLSLKTKKNVIIEKNESKLEKAPLWVDKYKPKNFMDLVGNEKVNRMALTWIKGWDYCVFGKEMLAKQSIISGQVSLNNKKMLLSPGFQKKKFYGNEDMNEYEDRFKRPFKKIMLLSGPPGIGKTTLANIIAKQAGYKPIEINASDDRTSAHLLNQLDTVTTNLGINERESPQLLIIDEIDGVSSSRSKDNENFVSLLVKLVNEDLEASQHSKKAKGENLQEGSNSKPKKKKRKVIRRPIICICNDLYAKVLTPLRDASLVVQLGPPSGDKIVNHLLRISKKEQLIVDSHFLSSLIKTSRGDIRSCINFLQAMKKTDLSPGYKDPRILNSFNKDTIPSIYEVWDAVFTEINHLQHKKLFNIQFDKSKAGHLYMDHLIRVLNSFGEYDSIFQGCFENYLKVNTRDTNLSKFTDLAENWILFYDILGTKISANPINGYALSGYLPYTFVAFNQVCGNHLGVDNGTFGYPRSENKANKLKREYTTVAHDFLNNISITETKLPKSLITFSTYVHSYILRILSPNLSAGNLTLYTKEMKKALFDLVAIMKSLNLKYIQNKTEDGNYIFELSPPLDKIIKTSDQFMRYTVPIKYQARMLISQELEKMKISVLSEREQRDSTIKPNQLGEISNDKKGNNIHKRRVESVEKMGEPNGIKSEEKGKGIEKVLEKPSKRVSNLREFFGIKPQKKSIVHKTDNNKSELAAKKDGVSETQGQGVSKKESAKYKVWYIHNDGFSNA